MSIGRGFSSGDLFRIGDYRIFAVSNAVRLPEQGFPWGEVGARLAAKKADYDGVTLWSFEDLRTGLVHGWYNAKHFSTKKLTEMEVIAWASK